MVFQKLALKSVLLAGLGLWLSLSGNARADVKLDLSDVEPGQVIVGIRAEMDNGVGAQAIAQYGRTINYIAAIHAYVVQLNPDLKIGEAITALQQRPEVRYAEPNGHFYAVSIPNDSSWNMQYGPAKIQAPEAWDLWDPSNSSSWSQNGYQFVIAINDTGVDTSHPDLVNKILKNPDGSISCFNTLDHNTNCTDRYGHGTHCSGIAAAQINNSTGIAGIAAWNGKAGESDVDNIKIMPVKVLGDGGGGTWDSVAEGITYATDAGAAIISMSLGGSGGSQATSDACAYAYRNGVLVVCAAGNNGSNQMFYPAAYKNVLSVAATDRADNIAGFSNYGPWVEVAAPGVAVYSTLPVAGSSLGRNYGNLDGTSMACPHVAGAAALIWSQNAYLSNQDVFDALANNTEPYNGRAIKPGRGRINVFMAIQGVLGQ